MKCEMSLDHLERKVAAAIDFATSIGRPLLASERDNFRWLLVAAKCASVKRALYLLKPAAVASHKGLIDRLRAIVNPDQAVVLAHLERMTMCFLDYVAEINRPLLKSEKSAFLWMLKEWVSRPVKSALAELSEPQLEYFWGLHAQLRELLAPDPVQQIRLQREKPEVEIELNDGNFSPVSPPFFGVSIRRMNATEAKERIGLMASLGHDIASIAQELSLVRNDDKAAAKRMIRLGRRMTKLSQQFLARCKAAPEIPEERSIEEVMHDMRIMSDLMSAVEEPP